MLTRFRVALAAALSLLALAPALAADNYQVKDATGATIAVKSKEIAPGVHSPQFVPSDSTGAEKFVPANPGSVSGNVGAYASVATASFARPANTTAYAAGQLVANSTTAGSVAAMQFTAARTTGGTGLVRRARLTKSSTSLLYTNFEILLYRATAGGACPTSAAGDGATYSTDSALLYVGRIPVSMDVAFTDGAKGIGTPNTGSEIVFDAPAGYQTLCGFLRATGAYTPVSGETFTAALEILPN
ncbi:UNVERIFIED_CONTAM: hypothetical protein Q9R58_22160 [Methylobacteriaceae bacterium AG10]|nr:hypothetical protein [Methylobacteriaceae bacterium AG10]